MMFFELIQYYLAIVGIDSDHANRKCLLNKRNVTVITIFVVTAIFKIMYFVHEAKTFVEYTESLYVISTLFAAIFSFAIIIWKMPQLFEFMNDFECSINESK